MRVCVCGVLTLALPQPSVALLVVFARAVGGQRTAGLDRWVSGHSADQLHVNCVGLCTIYRDREHEKCRGDT